MSSPDGVATLCVDDRTFEEAVNFLKWYYEDLGD